MAITASGSGLDIPSLVTSLVASARTPAQTRINAAGTVTKATLSAVGQIRSSMSSLQTALNKVTSGVASPAFTSTVSSTAGFTASAGAGAIAGSYSVEVLSLASAQKLASAGSASDASFGAGTLTFAYGDASIEVEIGEGASLDSVAAAINRAAGGKGVVASVVTSDQGRHLVFNAAGSGTANALTITSTGSESLKALTTGADGTLSTTVQAADARVRVDGLERTASSNVITDLIPGTTLTLSKVSEGTAEALTLTADNTALKASVEAFVTAYNSTIGVLKSTSSYDSTTQKASALTGDSMVRGLQQQLRGQLSGDVEALKALGLSLDKDGRLSLNSATFDAGIAGDPARVGALFGEDGTLTKGLAEVFDGALDSIDGVLTTRTETLNKQVKVQEQQLEALDLRMEGLYNRYLSQFTAMEMMITQMQVGGSSLNSLLSSS